MDTMNDHANLTLKPALGKSIAIVLLATLALLLIPALAMQMTAEVNWGPGDFAAAGLLLGATGVAYVVLARRLRSAGQRIAAGAVLGLVLLTVWVELAVGIFD